MNFITENMGYIIVGALIAFLLGRCMINRGKIHYYRNDLTKDSKRWSELDLKIASYASLFLSKKIRTNDHFRVVMCAILKRSPQAVAKKINRLKSVGEMSTQASERDIDVVLNIIQLEEREAQSEFIENLFASGASNRQVAEIKKYL